LKASPAIYVFNRGEPQACLQWVSEEADIVQTFLKQTEAYSFRPLLTLFLKKWYPVMLSGAPLLIYI